jgi:hypothetical protein
MKKRILPLSIAAVLLTAAPLPLLLGQSAGPSAAAKKPAPAPRVEVHLTDGSTLKMLLLDERLEFVTPYGNLLIPVSQIERIEFATRVSDEVASRIALAIGDLGHPDPKRRNDASDELEGLGESAYGALLAASHDPDPEVVRRAENLLARLRQSVPPERLAGRPQDVIYTADSKISGRLTAAALRVESPQFGEQQLKLFDIRELHPAGSKVSLLSQAQPDPGNLNNFREQIGKTFVFKVTGAVPNGGGTPVWGTETYTVDSNLAVAAVHAGVLRSGQTGAVRVTIVGHVQQFTSTSQNGITSNGYNGYPGYRIHR